MRILIVMIMLLVPTVMGFETQIEAYCKRVCVPVFEQCVKDNMTIMGMDETAAIDICGYRWARCTAKCIDGRS